MYLTEEEAKQKRCCGPHGCGSWQGYDDGGTPIRFCIASECMAWHWEGGQYNEKYNWVKGYCGLAWKPED